MLAEWSDVAKTENAKLKPCGGNHHCIASIYAKKTLDALIEKQVKEQAWLKPVKVTNWATSKQKQHAAAADKKQQAIGQDIERLQLK